jgi:hypothetical protein
MARRKPADPLATYNRKRDFRKTAEPRGTFDKILPHEKQDQARVND